MHAQVRSPWYFEGVPQGLLVLTVADERPVASSVTDRSLPPRSSTVFSPSSMLFSFTMDVRLHGAQDAR